MFPAPPQELHGILLPKSLMYPLPLQAEHGTDSIFAKLITSFEGLRARESVGHVVVDIRREEVLNSAQISSAVQLLENPV